jgi:hypothetical protein
VIQVGGRLIALCIAITSFVVHPMAAQQQPTAAMIDHITCDALWRPSDTSKESWGITEVRDRGRYLRIGEEVKCTSKSGDITLLLYTGEDKHVTFRSDWFPIAPAGDVVQKQEKQAELVAQALRHHGPRAGTRAPAYRVYYPAPDGVARVENFVIRWRPEPAPRTINLSILVLGSPEAIWKDDNVNSASGSLDSPLARQALKNLLQGKPDAQLLLALRFAQSESFSFFLISVQQAHALEDELKFWDRQQNDLLRFIGRAYSFDQRNLYWEAAREYEEALKLAPSSCDLLNEAIAANERARDQEHARQLKEARSKILGGCPDRISQ